MIDKISISWMCTSTAVANTVHVKITVDQFDWQNL